MSNFPISLQPASSNPPDPRVQQVRILIAANLPHPWQITELAEHVMLSPRQLTRCFRLGTRYSPLQYLHLCRLQKAAELLCTTFEQINQIAQQVGIPDTRYFRRSFKDHFADTPGDYRRRYARQIFAASNTDVAIDPQMSV